MKSSCFEKVCAGTVGAAPPGSFIVLLRPLVKRSKDEARLTGLAAVTLPRGDNSPLPRALWPGLGVLPGVLRFDHEKVRLSSKSRTRWLGRDQLGGGAEADRCTWQGDACGSLVCLRRCLTLPGPGVLNE